MTPAWNSIDLLASTKSVSSVRWIQARPMARRQHVGDFSPTAPTQPGICKVDSQPHQLATVAISHFRRPRLHPYTRWMSKSPYSHDLLLPFLSIWSLAFLKRNQTETLMRAPLSEQGRITSLGPNEDLIAEPLHGLDWSADAPRMTQIVISEDGYPYASSCLILGLAQALDFDNAAWPVSYSNLAPPPHAFWSASSCGSKEGYL
jgi:hypothetical protein